MDNMPWAKKYPENHPWNCQIQTSEIFDLLERTANKFGEKPAFDFLGFRQNWAEIHTLSLKLAKGLQSIGVKKGMKIGLFLPNCPYFLIAYYAIAKTGATIVNYNPLYARSELINQIEDSETDIMITADLAALYPKMDEIFEETRLQKLILCKFTDILPFPKNILFKLLKGKDLAKIQDGDERIHWFHDLTDNDGQPENVEIDPGNDIALLQYTGGTTGLPKGAMLTHANITANTEQCALWFQDAKEGQEKMLGVIPFFHVFAMTAVMNLSVRLGFEIVAIPRFDLDQTLKLIAKEKPHFFPAVPAIYTAINNHKDLKKYDLSSLRYCVSGGAPLPVEVKKKFESETGCVLVEGYGLTESSPVACVNPVWGENKPGSIGLPIFQTEIEIINPEDKETRMALGERGELCIRGPQVMKGYWKREEETKDVLRDGLLYTGDIAVMDEDGYVYIVDRIKDLIITNGYNVYPRMVEEAIYQHESVEECIVAGIPDERRGELVKAWIKLKEGAALDEASLKKFLEDRLSPMERPRKVEFRDDPLPKTMIGKLSRKDILKEEPGG